MDLRIIAWGIVLAVGVFSLFPGIRQLLIEKYPKYIKNRKKYLFMSNDGIAPDKQNKDINIAYKYIENNNSSFEFEV